MSEEKREVGLGVWDWLWAITILGFSIALPLADIACELRGIRDELHTLNEKGK